ncbi:MAG: DUF58 domain-containing protein [Microbacteriaceae bacterium]|nr:DUF58 domain-containing protein [Microbacteriaceae bacterium]
MSAPVREQHPARLTHTSTASGVSARTQSLGHTQTQTHVAPLRRDGRLVRLVVWWMRVWQTVSAAMRRAWRWLTRTVTAAGLLIVLAATVGIAVGVAFGWVEWIVAGAAAGALLLLAVPFLFGANAYEVDLSMSDARVVAGSTVTGEIVVRNRGRGVALPGRIDIPVGDGLIELGVPLLLPGRAHAETLTIDAPRRGVIPVGPATAVRSDPVGLLRRERSWADRHRLFVHPRTVAVPATSAGLVRDLEGSPTRQLVDADIAFHAIREYVPGDSRRQIHWKSTAKTGRLMVRQFEESRRSRLAVVLSLAEAEYADEDEFELGVSAAASLGAQAIRDGRELDVVTGAEVPEMVRGRMRAIHSLAASSPRVLLDEFTGVRPLAHTMPFAEVCRLAGEAAPGLSLVFMVCGSQVGLQRLRQAALALPMDAAAVAVICDAQAQPRIQSFGALTVLTIGLLDDLPGLMMRNAV